MAGVASVTREELAAWDEALARDFIEFLKLLGPVRSDSARLEAGLRALLAMRPERAVGIARVLGCLDAAGRLRLATEMAEHPRVSVRAEFLRVNAPQRLEVPGSSPRWLPDEAWDPWLRSGLMGEDPDVREYAASIAFGLSRGTAVARELIACAETGSPALRWRSLLALGSAEDPASLALLLRTLAGPDEGLAGAAVRALAARPDGRNAWQRALADPRAHVRNSARFAAAVVGREPGAG